MKNRFRAADFRADEEKNGRSSRLFPDGTAPFSRAYPKGFLWKKWKRMPAPGGPESRKSLDLLRPDRSVDRRRGRKEEFSEEPETPTATAAILN
jgi:hypothetical protein